MYCYCWIVVLSVNVMSLLSLSLVLSLVIDKRFLICIFKMCGLTIDATPAVIGIGFIKGSILSSLLMLPFHFNCEIQLMDGVDSVHQLVPSC